MLGFGESLSLEEVMVKDLANDQLKGAHLAFTVLASNTSGRAGEIVKEESRS